MAEDNQNNLPEDEHPEVAPSTLFLEMMRQAAARKAEEDAPVSDSSAYEPEESSDLPYLEEPDFLREQDYAQVANDIQDSDEEARIEPEEIVSPPRLSSEPETVIDAVPAIDARVPIYEVPTSSEANREAQLKEQRVQRIRRRQERQFQRRVGIAGGFFRTIFVTTFAAALASTIFMWFMDAKSITPSVGSQLQVAASTSVVAAIEISPTPIPITPNYLRQIGIVSGHRGPINDPGAVCPDGLTETEINFAIAQLVVRDLRERSFAVDLLDEFDPRLDNYKAAALISIHSNDCSDYEGGASGYLVSRAISRPAGGPDDVLAECLSSYYQAKIGLERRFSLTVDMTDYHTFREMHSLTPAAIIELGFMRDDRALLVERQAEIADGLVAGILCFLSGENPIARPTSAPVPLDGTATGD
jgi:N-acetylmuramoyl-L-alanine amidase